LDDDQKTCSEIVESVDPCADFGCSDICSVDPQTGRPLCSCPDNGSELFPDFRTCGFGTPDVYTRNYAFIVDKEEQSQVFRVYSSSRPNYVKKVVFDTKSTFGVNYKLFYFEHLYHDTYHIKSKKDDLCLTVDHSGSTIIGQKLVAKPCLGIPREGNDLEEYLYNQPHRSQKFWFVTYGAAYGGVGNYQITNSAVQESGFLTRTSEDELEIRHRGDGQQWFSIDCNGECGLKS